MAVLEELEVAMDLVKLEEAVEKEKRVAVLEAARVAVDLVVLEELEDAAIVVG